MDLLIATRNKGKISEIQTALAELPLQLRYLDEFPNIPAVEEIGATFGENANLKALEYARNTRLPALADDSGLEVDALEGLPGVFSARYGGTSLSDKGRTSKLLAALEKFPTEQRTARFICYMALAIPTEGNEGATAKTIHVASGECLGRIAREARGQNGFGYDPVFVPAGYSQSLADLPASVKQSVSHRARAIAGMRDFMKRWVGLT